MDVNLRYLGRSGMIDSGAGRILQMAPNLDRDEVAVDAPLKQPLRFREAISALHDIVINDLTFQPRDKTQYQEWRNAQFQRENEIRRHASEEKAAEIERTGVQKPSESLKTDHQKALKRYWASRRELNTWLRKNDHSLWRKLMPYDPVITVADDVLMFECFSADESSYGCLSVDRDCFGSATGIRNGTTNVDYSWDLYDNFQSLRTYRETRFNINPEGFNVRTEETADYHEEKIELPDGWLRGFMSLQSAMGLPMRRVPLSKGAVYSLLAYLKRHKAKTSPRGIRFELADGKAPRLVLEPWEREIESKGTVYNGPNDDPIRIWGRRRLLTLARLLPLVERFDVYLLGTGLPSFWVAKMGNMRLTLGLSGWTANDWTKGSAVQMLLPPQSPTDALIAETAKSLTDKRAVKLADIAAGNGVSVSEMAGALNQLALRGQAIYDLDADQFRWRQILPIALSDRELGEPHPELVAAKQILVAGKIKIKSHDKSPRGGAIITATVERKDCEVLISDDGMIRRGKCYCSWHHKFGIRNGPCRHLQAIRDLHGLGNYDASKDWYQKRLQWAGR